MLVPFAGLAQQGRAAALQAVGRGFDPLNPYQLQQTDKALAHETGRWDARGLLYYICSFSITVLRLTLNQYDMGSSPMVSTNT